MNTGFRCECCGRKIPLAFQDALTETRCPHCGKRMKLPGSPAAPPDPHGHADVIEGRPMSPMDLVGACAEGACAAPEDGVITRTMPWLLSVVLHLGLAVVLMFLAMLTIPPRVGVVPPVPPESVTVDASTPQRLSVPETSRLLRAWTARPPRRATGAQRHKPLSAETPALSRVGKGPVIIAPDPGRGTGGEDDIDWPGPEKGIIFPPVPIPPGRRADHVVFVIDRSGSMVGKFDAVRQAMELYIGEMSPDQTFHVILYAAKEILENRPRRLVPATDEAKIGVVDFLHDIQPVGQTDPVPALRRAFAVLSAAGAGRRNAPPSETTLQTKVIYLLSDGEFPESDKVVETVRTLNPKGRQRVHVNTTLYGMRSPEAAKVMKLIAEENKGRYKYMSPDE